MQTVALEKRYNTEELFTLMKNNTGSQMNTPKSNTNSKVAK